MIVGHKITLVLPCYNEEEGVAAMLPKVPKEIDEVVVVDNNCTDRTAEIAQSHGCVVVKEPVPGYGAAHKRGYRTATGDVVSIMDADDTYPLNELVVNIKLLIDKNYDFVSCSRFPLKDPVAMNITNQLGNFVLNMTTLVLFGRRIMDTQSGMMIFRRSIFDRFFPKSNGMPLCQEMKLLALKHHCRFFESHITYSERVGETKLNKWKDGFENLAYLFKLRFSR